MPPLITLTRNSWICCCFLVCEATHTGKCAGRSRPACWSAEARADLERTASPCRPRRTPTGPRSPPSPARARTAASALGCETSRLTCGTIPPEGRQRSRHAENFFSRTRVRQTCWGCGARGNVKKRKKFSHLVQTVCPEVAKGLL